MNAETYFPRVSRLASLALALAAVCGGAGIAAQGPPQDQYHGDNHHGQDQRYRDDRGDRGRPQDRPQDRRDGDRGGPPSNYHFGNDDRSRFSQHYRSDALRWRNRRDRPRFYAGYAIPRGYSIRSVPSAYWAGSPPPPPGYQYGYYDGYVVSYNPATRIIADVLDLVTGN